MWFYPFPLYTLYKRNDPPPPHPTPEVHLYVSPPPCGFTVVCAYRYSYQVCCTAFVAQPHPYDINVPINSWFLLPFTLCPPFSLLVINNNYCMYSVPALFPSCYKREWFTVYLPFSLLVIKENCLQCTCPSPPLL